MKPALPVLPIDVINSEYRRAKFKEESGMAEDQERTIEVISSMVFKLYLATMRLQHTFDQF